MKHFGIVESYDETKGSGVIKQEQGGKTLPFERKAFSWADKAAPTIGKRLSYELADANGVSSVTNLQNA